MALQPNATYETQLESLIAAPNSTVTPDSKAFYAAIITVMKTMFSDATVSVNVPALGLAAPAGGGAVTGTAAGSGSVG